MRRFQKFVIDLQPIMDQPARVLRSQNRRGLGKAASRQNLAVGNLLGVAILERRTTIHKISSLGPFGRLATLT